jgi:hypothetical protein
MTTIPQSPEEITCEWLNDALGAEGILDGTEITEFTLETVGDGQGFLSALVRITPTYEGGHDELPATMIAKFPSKDVNERETGDALGAYARESGFYRNCASESPGHPPRHYHSMSNPGTDEHLIVIEDLGGARFVSQLGGVGHDDAMHIMRALAQVHAHYWERPIPNEAQWLPAYAEFAKIFPPEFETGAPQLVANWSYCTPKTVLDRLDAGNAAYPAVVHRLSEGPSTLVHCDPRIDNVAFSAGPHGDTVRLFDWQLASRGPAAYDVMYFMTQSLEPAVRRARQSELLGAYHDELVANGVTDYSRERLEDDIGLATCTLWGFLSLIGNIVFPDEKGKEIAERTLPRFYSMMEDFDAASRLREFV